MASKRVRPRAPPFIDPPGYARHRPEATLLYQLVERHYPEFAAVRALRGLSRREARRVQLQAPRLLPELSAAQNASKLRSLGRPAATGAGCCRCRRAGSAAPRSARATEINPNYAQGIYARAWTEVMAGRSIESRDHVDLAMRLSPLDPHAPRSCWPPFPMRSGAMRSRVERVLGLLGF